MDTRICTGSADEQVACVRAASSGFAKKTRFDAYAKPKCKRLRIPMLIYVPHRAANKMYHDHYNPHANEESLMLLTITALTSTATSKAQT